MSPHSQFYHFQYTEWFADLIVVLRPIPLSKIYLDYAILLLEIHEEDLLYVIAFKFEVEGVEGRSEWLGSPCGTFTSFLFGPLLTAFH